MTVVYDYYCLLLLFNTVNCGDPLKGHDDHKDAGSVIALGYSNPALEGSRVDLKCPPGLTLIGPNVSTCMENGEWEPDLGEVECQGKI